MHPSLKRFLWKLFGLVVLTLLAYQAGRNATVKERTIYRTNYERVPVSVYKDLSSEQEEILECAKGDFTYAGCDSYIENGCRYFGIR